MLNADKARSLTSLAKFNRHHQGTLDLIESRIRGAAAAASHEVIIDIQGNLCTASDAEIIADLVRDKGYAVRAEEQGIEPNQFFRFTVSWN